MTSSETFLSYLRDPRLAPHATSAGPAWLWADDASRALWTNAPGATLLGEASPAALSRRRFHPNHPAAREIMRIVAALSAAATDDLVLSHAVGGDGPVLACSCARIEMAGGTAGVLVAAREAAGPTLPLAERVRLLLADADETAAVFAPDGTLVHAGSEAAGHLEGCACLGMVGVESLLAEALATGTAQSKIAGGELTLTKLGSAEAAVLLATFSAPAAPGEPVARAPAGDGRPQLTVVPPAKNVVPFRGAGPPSADRRPALTPVEHSAFQEIARALGARVAADDGPAEVEAAPAEDAPTVSAERIVLDRMPIAVLAYRGDKLIYANRALFEWTGFRDLGELAAAGGFDRLFAEPALSAPTEPDAPGRPVSIVTRTGETLPVEARLFSVPWEGETALLLMLAKTTADARSAESELALRSAEADARELASILDTATDGVVVVDTEARVLAVNRSAEALFGYAGEELSGRAFADLFAPESRRDALDYLAGLAHSGVASILNDGREVIGQVRQGGLVPLFMTMGRIADGPRFCAVLRDVTQWKRAEEELVDAKRAADRTSSAKSELLAKLSHEIRTPLNTIIGFSEVMMEGRFGPVGNERYREYLKDIHASGQHLMTLVNDLLDLSRFEAGRVDLTFARVDLNEATRQAVARMQPQANRGRIIIRTSLSTALPPVIADAASIRQIVVNLLARSIASTEAGGQVIVSTAPTGSGEAVLRVRDTGPGMSEAEIATALEPFRQWPGAGSSSSAGRAGLGLPLTKALAEANRASFRIDSVVNSGTLIEIVFPAARVPAE